MLLIILNSELNRSYTLDLFIYMRFCIVLIHFSQRLKALDGKRRFALAAAASHEEEVGRLRYYLTPSLIFALAASSCPFCADMSTAIGD